jgi:predicted hydrocarbon binding protein
VETERIRREGWEDDFWKEFSSVSDYFGEAIAPLQKKFGVGSKELMFQLGVLLGQNAAKQMEEASSAEMLDRFVSLWSEYRLGRLEVLSRAPLEILISDCRICGQLQGTGEMYECALHEGFFEGALSLKLGRPVTFKQDTNYEGAAGTWCRRLSSDVNV